MGLTGSYIAGSSVFWLTAILTIPAILALAYIPANELQYEEPVSEGQDWKQGVRRLASDRGVLVFAGCCALFGLANTAMLPLAGSEMTANVGQHANLIIAACIVVPQIMVAMLSPLIGRLAETHGRRPVLIIGFAAVAIRGVLLALLSDYTELVVLVQTLDGVSATMLGVLLPLLAADLTRGTNRFNLCIGVFGLANGLGATLSTAAAGSVADHLGASTAFLALAVAGVFAVLLAWSAMPETMRSKG
jgi:MFS family permease